MKEAEEHAAEDKKRKDLAEAKNHADSLIHQTEKNVAEYGAKPAATRRRSRQRSRACARL